MYLFWNPISIMGILRFTSELENAPAPWLPQTKTKNKVERASWMHLSPGAHTKTLMHTLSAGCSHYCIIWGNKVRNICARSCSSAAGSIIRARVMWLSLLLLCEREREREKGESKCRTRVALLSVRLMHACMHQTACACNSRSISSLAVLGVTEYKRMLCVYERACTNLNIYEGETYLSETKFRGKLDECI